MIIVAYACNTSRIATKEVVGIELKDLPCSGDKYMSDKDYFIANNSAKSNDPGLAREKALLISKQRLSGLISSRLKSATDRYINERGFKDRAEIEQKYENLTREVINQTLTDVQIICEKQTVLPDGDYQVFIAIAVSREDILNNMEKGLSSNEELKLDYDKYKYEQIFNSEMETYAEE